jgi:peptidase M28-like protein/PDZ domain-containing protein/PA domain-containing protein
MKTTNSICKGTVLAVFILFLVQFISAQNKNEITVSELEEHVYFLSSDSLKGRKPGTPGGKIAAEYIRDQLIESGLNPLGEDGFQYFSVTTNVEPGDNNRLIFDGAEVVFGEDFKPMAFSSNNDLEAEVVFAGYGIELDHDSVKWNDYENIDIEGKWVLILRGDPEPDNDSSLFIAFSGDRDKVLTARDNKAAGVIFVNGVNSSADDKLMGNTFNRVTASAGLPAINITRAIADSILGDGKTISELEKKIIDSKETIGFTIPTTISVSTDLNRVEVKTQNIIAIIEGSDPELKNDYVLIGAHYDHLGMGGHGSGSRNPDTIAIHNGADDNASGVAAVIELAEKFNSEKGKLKRSVIFMAFGAEEMGLLGSQFFTNDALVSLKEIVLMVNFDMIGRFDPEKRSLMIAGTGTAEQMEELLNRHEENSDMSFTHSPEGYGASDHASFYGAGIPVMFFFTGAHEDYHTPFDDADKVNYEGEKEIIDFTYPVILEVINSDEGLVYKEAGPLKKQSRSGRGGLKVKFGIMPDFTSTTNDGLGVGGVTPGGPGAIAGMLKDDKIVAIEGLPVTNIYDYMARLKKLKPGQRISVDIIRNGEKKILMILL